MYNALLLDNGGLSGMVSQNWMLACLRRRAVMPLKTQPNIRAILINLQAR